jgi:hypothetical protein
MAWLSQQLSAPRREPPPAPPSSLTFGAIRRISFLRKVTLKTPMMNCHGVYSSSRIAVRTSRILAGLTRIRNPSRIL